MTKTRLTLLFFGALALFMIGFTYFYAKRAYPSSVCINTEVSRLLSPTSEFEAVVFQRQCGKSADPSAHISVLEAGSELDNSFGNAVIAKGSTEEAFGTLVWGSDTLAVKLNTSDVLSVDEEPLPGVEIKLTKD